jgi:hypothetical protein
MLARAPFGVELMENWVSLKLTGDFVSRKLGL